MGRGWALAGIALFLLGAASLASVAEYSYDSYSYSLAGRGVLDSIWSWGLGEGLDLELHGSYYMEYGGAVVTVERYSFSLYPGMEECRVYAWRYYTPRAGGAWVVLIHGLGGDHSFFEDIGGFNAAGELALLGLNVLAIDAAGHGESCIPGGVDWRDKAFTRDPRDFFLVHVYASGVRAVEAAYQLGASRVAVAGVSMGGMTSYVVASLARVDMAVPIVAAGCIPCMVASGGLANLVGPSDLALDEEALGIYSPSDPLSYIAAYPGGVEGKLFIILYSTHDEFFPLESLEATVRLLEEAGARVYVSLAPNNNHYSMTEEWRELLVEVFRAYAEGGPGAVEEALEAGAPGRLEALLGGYWRPPVDGLAFTRIPLIGLVMPVELVDPGSQSPRQPYRSGALWGGAASLALYVAGAAAASRAVGAARASLMAASTILYVALLSMPYYSWPGRFTLSILEALDRYGATPGLLIGAPTLEASTALIALGAALIAASVVVESRLWLAAAGAAYTASALAPHILVRLTIDAIESQAIAEPRFTIYPIEPLYIALFLVIAASRRIEPLKAPR